MGRTILAAALLAAVLATAAHPTTSTANPVAPTAAKEQTATAKQVVTKTPTPTPTPAAAKPAAKPSAPPVTTKPAPPPTSSRQLRYTAPRDVEVQTMCDDNGNAYDIHPNTAPARELAAEMCNNLQVGLDRSGFSH
jgi:hypothetical protein